MANNDVVALYQWPDGSTRHEPPPSTSKAPAPNSPQALAQQALAPVLAALKAQQDEEKTRAANAQATAGASAQGLSQALAPIPGQIEDTYKRAGDTTSAYAKGFSTAFQEGSEQTANDLNAFLQKQGSPQQVQSAGAKGADVLYGLGGFIPASGLAREGAAFSSAAQAFPASALLRGQENQAAIGRESAAKLAQLDSLMGQERAKLPGLASDFRTKAAEDRRAEQALQIQKWYLENTLRQTGAQITGVDPVTGLPTVSSQADVAEATAKKAKDRAAAVAKRNNATAESFLSASDWVEEQLKPGTTLVPKAQEPIVIRKQKVGKEEVTIYAKKGGGETKKVSEAETKTVYDQQLLPKPQYDKLYKGLLNRLTVQLRRYGYKRKQLSEMADDILSDYFAVVGGQAPNPTVPDRTGPPPNKR